MPGGLVLTASGVKKFSRTKLILLAVKTKRKRVMDIMKVLTVHRNLGANRRATASQSRWSSLFLRYGEYCQMRSLV